jgi:8-oxo-dGTP diphosphatase
MPKPDSRRAIVVVAAVIEKDGRYLITQRRPSAVLPLLWEFPGGKVEPGESDEDALAREVRHRLGVEIEVREVMNRVHHSYEKYAIDLHLYACTLSSGEPEPRNVHNFRWVSSAEFDSVAFTPADERSMSQLLELN